MIKILFLSDTHLGFDMPMRPRITRRRRGADFFANYKSALQPAFMKKVDLVLHGGDLFFRSRVHPSVIEMAFAPLLELAEMDIPVFLVPGNHERSSIPMSLLESHPNIFVFYQPKTFLFALNNQKLALSGFPYYRKGIQKNFNSILQETEYHKHDANIRILCMHHIVEGAQVGYQDYTFRQGPDIIKGSQIPADFAAILSGHIHREQILKKDLNKNPLAAPVIYPGSTERTSFSERNETKGYYLLQVAPSETPAGCLKNVLFSPLPTRPMLDLEYETRDIDVETLKRQLSTNISQLNPDSIVRLKLNGPITEKMISAINAKFLRSIAPTTMNISLAAFNPLFQQHKK